MAPRRWQRPPRLRWFLAAWGLFALACLIPATRQFLAILGEEPTPTNESGMSCLLWGYVFLFDALVDLKHAWGVPLFLGAMSLPNTFMLLSPSLAFRLPRRGTVFLCTAWIGAAMAVHTLSWFVFAARDWEYESLFGSVAWAASYFCLSFAFFQSALLLPSREAQVSAAAGAPGSRPDMTRSRSLGAATGTIALALLAVADLLWARSAARPTRPAPPPPTPLRTEKFFDVSIDEVGEGWCCSHTDWTQLRDEKGGVVVARCGIPAKSSRGLVAVAETPKDNIGKGRLLFIDSHAPVRILLALEPGTFSYPAAGQWSPDGLRFLVCDPRADSSSIRVFTFDADGHAPPKSEMLSVAEGASWAVKGLPAGLDATPRKLRLLSTGSSWSASGKSFAVGQWLSDGSMTPGTAPLNVLFRCSANPPRVEEAVSLPENLFDPVAWEGETPRVLVRK